MGLQISGSVRCGDTAVRTEVKLQIREKGTDNPIWETCTDTLDDGTFYHEIVDQTGQNRDYKGRTLHGEVIGDARFPFQDVMIPGTAVEIHFRCVVKEHWWTKLPDRMKGAALLSSDRYEEIVDSAQALPQAALVAVLASVVFAAPLAARNGLGGIVGGGLLILLGLGILTLFMYLLGTTVLAAPTTRTTLGRFIRATGFATTPLLIGGVLVALIAAIGAPAGIPFLVLIATIVWEVAALIVAVHQAVGYRQQWGRAVLVVMIPVALVLVVTVLLASA